jgi:hypothetical protein
MDTAMVSTVYIRAIDGRTLFSLKIPDKESSADQYLFGRIEKHGDEMFLIPPHLFWFKRFVEDGHLSGEVHLGRVVLRDLTSPEMEVFVTRWMHFIFDVENPMIFRRSRESLANLGLQRTWPLYSGSVAALESLDFWNTLLLGQAGHAPESRC